jgi:hypothetical protein
VPPWVRTDPMRAATTTTTAAATTAMARRSLRSVARTLRVPGRVTRAAGPGDPPPGRSSARASKTSTGATSGGGAAVDTRTRGSGDTGGVAVAGRGSGCDRGGRIGAPGAPGSDVRARRAASAMALRARALVSDPARCPGLCGGTSLLRRRSPLCPTHSCSG